MIWLICDLTVVIISTKYFTSEIIYLIVVKKLRTCLADGGPTDRFHPFLPPLVRQEVKGLSEFSDILIDF